MRPSSSIDARNSTPRPGPERKSTSTSATKSGVVVTSASAQRSSARRITSPPWPRTSTSGRALPSCQSGPAVTNSSAIGAGSGSGSGSGPASARRARRPRRTSVVAGDGLDPRRLDGLGPRRRRLAPVGSGRVVGRLVDRGGGVELHSAIGVTSAAAISSLVSAISTPSIRRRCLVDVRTIGAPADVRQLDRQRGVGASAGVTSGSTSPARRLGGDVGRRRARRARRARRSAGRRTAASRAWSRASTCLDAVDGLEPVSARSVSATSTARRASRGRVVVDASVGRVGRRGLDAGRSSTTRCRRLRWCRSATRCPRRPARPRPQPVARVGRSTGASQPGGASVSAVPQST